MIDPELAANRPSGRDVLVQRVRLGNACRATCQTPQIAFRVGVMLIGGRRGSDENAQAGWVSWSVVIWEWTDGSA